MSKEHIGPFGTEQQAAGAKAIHAGHGCTCRAGAKGDARAVLSAAVGALDREALIEAVFAALRDNGHIPQWHYRVHAKAVIEALFPTEPEVQDGR